MVGWGGVLASGRTPASIYLPGPGRWQTAGRGFRGTRGRATTGSTVARAAAALPGAYHRRRLQISIM